MARSAPVTCALATYRSLMSKRAANGKRPANGIRLHGWIEPRPNSDKYDFGERAYSQRTGLYHARLRYRPPGEKTIRTVREFRAETAERLIELAQGEQLELTQRLRRDGLSSSEREHALLFSDGLARYRDEHLAHCKQNVREKEPPQINKWIVPFLGGFTLAELKQDGRRIGHEWVNWMRSEQPVTWRTSGGKAMSERKRAPAGYRVASQALEIAKGILNVYRDELDLMEFERNPFDGVTVKKESHEQRARHLEQAIPLSLVEAVAFYMEDIQDVALTLVLGELGLRQQEAHVLDWPHVLWPSGAPRKTIEVEQAVSGTGSNRAVGAPKSLSATRRVTLHPSTADVLLALWEERGRPPIEPGSLVFPGVKETARGEKTDGLLNRPGWLKWKFKPALAALYDGKALIALAKLHGKLTPHRLRSAAASAVGYAAISRAEAMLNFGWSRIDTMILHYERAYLEPDPELRGVPVDEQIVSARRQALAGVPALRKRLDAAIPQQKTLVEEAVRDGMDANERRRRRAHLREAERRLARADLMEQRLREMIAAAEARA